MSSFLLQQFKSVNDISVYERLFAVTYGVILTSESKENLCLLAQYIYDEIFDKKQVIAHVLLRDYARNIIEFALVQKCPLNIDKIKILPPYRSKWYTNIPDTKKIKKMEYDYNAPDFKDYYWSQNSILSSIKGNTSDFDKDVLMSLPRKWKITLEEVQRIIIKRVFEMGYDVEKHGKYDRTISNSNYHGQKIERIGKKYQWQAFYEAAAIISDHKLIEKDAEKYNGPWDPYMRDIDPTQLITKTQTEQYKKLTKHWWFSIDYNNWPEDNKKWIHQKADLPKIESILGVKDNNNVEWLLLDVNPQWETPIPLGSDKYSIPKKDLYFNLEAYLIPKKNFGALLKYLSGSGKKDIENRHRNSTYEVFFREYYWSPAFKYSFETSPYYTQLSIPNYTSRNLISDCFFTSHDFAWEEPFDYSKEETIRFMIPSKILFDGLKLKFSDKEGEYLDNKGELICFDPSVNNPSTSCLVVRKKELEQFLQSANLVLIWMVNGEKRILDHYSHNEKKYWGRNNLAGFYYLKNGKICGSLNSKIEERD